MNRNKILITVLALMGLLFVGLLVVLVNAPQTRLNQISRPVGSLGQPTVAELVNLQLEPTAVTVGAGQTFTVKLNFQNLSAPISAADVLLRYNPELVEFVSVNNLNSQYLNPRALTENDQIILAFVNQTEIASLAGDSLFMAELVFRALKTGQTLLAPVFNETATSSMVLIEGNQQNQLTNANTVTIAIQ